MKDKPKKSPGSAQNRFCFTGDVLWQYKFGNMTPAQRTAVHQHLQQCDTCRDTYRILLPEPLDAREKESSKSRIRDRLKWLKVHERPVKLETVPRRLSPGQVWTTSLPLESASGDETGAIRMGMPVLVIHPGDGSKKSENRIRIMSISPDVEFHLNGETYFLEKGRKNPLGYPALVELFNEIPVSAHRLTHYRGKVSGEILEEIRAFRNSRWESAERAMSVEFNRWKTGEIEVAASLSATATAELWDDEDHTIVLQDYRLAADAEQVRLSEIRPQIIADTGDFILIAIQVRDKVMLRFFSKLYPPTELRINGEARKWRKTDGDNIWETNLGQVNQLLEEMEVSFSVAEQSLTYRLHFIPPESGGQ